MKVIKKQCNKGTSYLLNCLKKLDDVRDSIINSSSDFVNEVNPHLELSSGTVKLKSKKEESAYDGGIYEDTRCLKADIW